jgi:hypothetical protein
LLLSVFFVPALISALSMNKKEIKDDPNEKQTILSYVILPLCGITPSILPPDLTMAIGAILGIASYYRGKMQSNPNNDHQKGVHKDELLLLVRKKQFVD